MDGELKDVVAEVVAADFVAVVVDAAVVGDFGAVVADAGVVLAAAVEEVDVERMEPRGPPLHLYSVWSSI